MRQKKKSVDKINKQMSLNHQISKNKTPQFFTNSQVDQPYEMQISEEKILKSETDQDERVKEVLKQILDEENKRSTNMLNYGVSIPKYRKDIIR